MDDQQLQKPKKPWLPKSREGKRATVFSALAILWGILLPAIPSPEWMRGGLAGGINGLARVLILVVLLVLSFIYLHKAIFKIKDRAILVLILFCLFCLIAAFWLLFFIGEFVYPH